MECLQLRLRPYRLPPGSWFARAAWFLLSPPAADQSQTCQISGWQNGPLISGFACLQKTLPQECSAPGSQLVQGPSCVFGNRGIRISSHLFQFGNKIPVPAVAHVNRDIPPQPCIFGSLDGRAAEDIAELFLIHPRQPLEVGMKQLLLGLELRRGCRGCVAGLGVPGADVLADIAAEDLMAYSL